MHRCPCNITPLLNGQNFVFITLAIDINPGKITRNFHLIYSCGAISVLKKMLYIHAGLDVVIFIIPIAPVYVKIVAVSDHGNSDGLIVGYSWIIGFPSGDEGAEFPTILCQCIAIDRPVMVIDQ